MWGVQMERLHWLVKRARLAALAEATREEARRREKYFIVAVDEGMDVQLR